MTVADMSIEQLKKLVEETVDERLSKLLGEFELEDVDESLRDLTWDDIRASIEQHRWTPPPGAKSSLDFLREDRDS